MEQNLENSYNNVLLSVQNLMKEGFEDIEKARIRGKRKVYEESLKWMVDTYKGDLKFVDIDEFIRMVHERLNIGVPVQVVNYSSKKMITD